MMETVCEMKRRYEIALSSVKKSLKGSLDRVKKDRTGFHEEGGMSYETGS